MDINALLNEIEALLKKMKYQTARMEGVGPQLGDTLRAMVPVDEAGNAVLLEVMVIPLTEEAHLVQLYTTMIAEIGPGYEALKEMLLDWNLVCPIGAFGIFRAGRQFYHKYNYPIPVDIPPEEMALEILYLIDLIRGEVADVFPDAVRLSGHA